MRTIQMLSKLKKITDWLCITKPEVPEPEYVQPTLEDAHKDIRALSERLIDVTFYMTALSDHKVTAVQAEFLTKAKFNLSKAADELLITINERKEEERRARFATRH